MTKRVLSVGQCSVDHNALTRFINSHFDAEIVAADGATDALEQLERQPFDLVLVNRKLDIDYTDGLDVVKIIKADPKHGATPVMLVTNYPEHHELAVTAGAERGIGKLDYHKPEARARLAPFLDVK